MHSFLLYWSKILKKIRLSSIRDSVIHRKARINSGCNVLSTEMGRYSYCGYNCELINVKIGQFCSISNQVVIGGGSHPMHWVSTSPFFYEGKGRYKNIELKKKELPNKQTIIGNDVWIGQGVLIKAGLHIGDGAVIGMGSVVTKDVLPYAVVVGNPAKEIKKRFDTSTISMLLDFKWWDRPEDYLLRNVELFRNTDELNDSI